MPYDPSDPNDPRGGPQGYPGYAQQSVQRQQTLPASGYNASFANIPGQQDPADPRSNRRPFGTAGGTQGGQMPQAPQVPQAPKPSDSNGDPGKLGILQTSGYESPPIYNQGGGGQKQESMPLGGIQGGPIPQYISLSQTPQPQIASHQGGGFVPPIPGQDQQRQPQGPIGGNPWESPPTIPQIPGQGGKGRPPLGPRTPSASSPAQGPPASGGGQMPQQGGPYQPGGPTIPPFQGPKPPGSGGSPTTSFGPIGGAQQPPPGMQAPPGWTQAGDFWRGPNGELQPSPPWVAAPGGGGGGSQPPAGTREYIDYRNPPPGVDPNTLNLGDPVQGRPGHVWGYDIAGGGWFMTPQGSGVGQPFGGTPGEAGFPPGGGAPGTGQPGPGGVPTSYGGLYAPPDSTTYQPGDWQFDPASYDASANFEGINPATYQSGEAYNYNLPTYNPYQLQYQTPQGYQAGQLSQYQGWNPGAIDAQQQQAIQSALANPSMSAQGVSQLKEQQKEGSLSIQKQLQQQLAQSAASRGLAGGGYQAGQERRLGENLANSVLSGNRDIDIEKMQTDRSDLLNALGVAEQYQQGSFGRDLQGQQQRLQTEGAQEDLRIQQAEQALRAAGMDLEADALRAQESYRGYGSQADAQRFQYEQAGRRDDERFRGYESQQEAARFQSDQAQRGADDRWRAYQAGQTGSEFNLDQQLAREGLRRDSSDSSFRSYQADIARLAQSEELRRLQEALGLQGELSRGQLDLQGRQLGESGRQFDQGHALNWAQLLQQGNQFSQSLGLDYADLLQQGNLGQLQAMLQGLS